MSDQKKPNESARVAALIEAEPALDKGVSAWAVAWRQLKRDRVAMIAATSLVLLGLLSVLSPLLANDKPLWASYKGRWFFPAFKDYLDENIPIPFDIPAALRRSSGFFSPAYANAQEIPRPGGRTLPDWTAIKREIDGPEGKARGDWYLGAPIPYYYKQTSSAIKQLPFADVVHLLVVDGPGEGRVLQLVPKSVWSDEWTRLRSVDGALDLSGITVVHAPPAEGKEPRWVVRRASEAPDATASATVRGEPVGETPVALRPGDELVVGGRTLRVEVPPKHIMGTDDVGRDVFSRLIHGTVIAGSVGIVSVGIYVTIGIIIGALAGFFRGWVDIAISRLIEIVICFPTFFLIITIVALWEKPSIYNIMIALGLINWTGVARLIRGEFLKCMSEDYVAAARSLGLSNTRIIFRHILPNAIAPVFVSASFGVAGAILVESSLSFLGFGVAPPTASWGEILRQGRNYINENLYHLVWFPGVCIFFTVTMFNLLGEGLRDALDPRLRQ
ncbi:MAG: ABC transporter permease [Planctomycetes bacterium]|nr:ABC transporter permease [Planctomycetota bacterium]